MWNESEAVVELCSRRPLAIQVLQRHAIDPSDPRSLAACCQDRALEVGVVRGELIAEESRLAGSWRTRTLPELIDHIVTTYHQRLDAALTAAAAAISAAAPPSDGPAHLDWAALQRDLEELRADMAAHMAKEEQVLFPWLLGRADTAAAPIRAMQLEHTDTIQLLHALRAGLRRCLAASGRDPRTQAVAARLDEVERALCEHMHLESNELFPRALDGDPRR
jgi:regulator of cell morphogenesis and NO signaling